VLDTTTQQVKPRLRRMAPSQAARAGYRSAR